MTLEEKYRHAILVLQSIAQRSGRDKKFGLNEWTEANAFHDCKEAATRCLLKLGEATIIKDVDSTKYEVWMQGFQVMEGTEPAELLGIYKADSFLDACQMAVNDHPGYIEYYEPERNCIWGCKLFDNEEDARRAFG